MHENERAVVQVRLTARDQKRVEALAASNQAAVSNFAGRLIREALEGEHKQRHQRSGQ